MDDFTAKAGRPNLFGAIQSERNAIAPGTPAFINDADVRPASGRQLSSSRSVHPAARQSSTPSQVITNVIDHGMNLQEAIDARACITSGCRMRSCRSRLDCRRTLAARSKCAVTKISTRERDMSDAQGVMIEEKTNVRLGASDSRRDGAAVGY
jgi:gamma-glutamyltranspeptidase/glutathione hydrolase